MITFYLIPSHDKGLPYLILGFNNCGEISRNSYHTLYSARMALYALEDEGNVTIDQTRENAA